jgi:phage/plasmid-like protein (TIGR03299 family)
MAHEIEGFVSVREPAWHGLGVVLPEHVSTGEMLQHGGLAGWNVRVEEVEIPDGYSSHKTQYRTVRDFDGRTDILGFVGERYHVFQNEELFAFGDALLDGGKWETAGSLRHGTRVFGALELDRDDTVEGDAIKSFLLLSSSHDGSAAIQASVTPIRVVCMNTLNFALRHTQQTFKIRHTQTVSGRVQAAREALGLADRYLDAWTVTMEELSNQTFTNLQFEAIVADLYKPTSESKSAATRWDKKQDVLWDLWNGPTVQTGTKWGALNALNEELMYFRGGRGDNSIENVAASRSGFNPVWNTENNKILQAVLSPGRFGAGIR